MEDFIYSVFVLGEKNASAYAYFSQLKILQSKNPGRARSCKPFVKFRARASHNEQIVI